MSLLLLALVLGGCKPNCEPSPEVPGDGIDQDCDGGDPSGLFRVLDTLEGAPDRGYGHSVAFWDGEIAVGAPLGDEPGVYVRGERVVSGPADAFTGSSVGTLVASPRDGMGRVLDAEGGVVWEGAGPTPGGGAPVRTERGVASLHPDGVRIGESFFATPSRPVSLLAVDLGSGQQVLAGLLGGGLWSEEGVLGDERELGRGLAACDFDGDGDDDLAVGAPASNEVRLYTVDDVAQLASAEPAAVLHPEPGRAGHALACNEEGLLVGAPQADGGAGWVGLYAAPLELDLAVAARAGARREGLGFALAVEGAQLVATAPGEARVYVLSPR